MLTICSQVPVEVYEIEPYDFVGPRCFNVIVNCPEINGVKHLRRRLIFGWVTAFAVRLQGQYRTSQLSLGCGKQLNVLNINYKGRFLSVTTYVYYFN